MSKALSCPTADTTAEAWTSSPRSDFEVAIIYALRSEADAVETLRLLDKCRAENGDGFGKAQGKSTVIFYTTRIARLLPVITFGVAGEVFAGGIWSLRLRPGRCLQRLTRRAAIHARRRYSNGNAANVAASLRRIFRRMRLALVVSICSRVARTT
jgi:hypothetical protein